ncbi:MAG: lipocalin family protein, partial [Flavobacteriaceae bacterium]|nr:lipocalin family protein [Flavobacteriaceae bacterium]
LIRKMFVAGVGVSLLVACSKESMNKEMKIQDVNAYTVEIQNLTVDDFVGRWNMYSMTSIGEGNSVDFDQDGNFTYDLLEETDCFDPMYFLFDKEGNVTTEQARLFFNGTTGKFSCQTTGNYVATYQISGNYLTVTFTVDGVQYTETKTVSRYSENGIDYLKVTLTEAETNSAVYVANDPGNTVASDIKQIDMIYQKVQ